MLPHLKALFEEDFYGSTLKLEGVEDSGPFGFSVSLVGSATREVKVKQTLGFLGDSRTNRWFQIRNSGIQGPHPYVSNSTTKATLSGYLIRILDSSNEDEDDLLLQLTRAVAEFRRVG